MISNYNQYHSKTTNFRISPSENLKDGIDFAMLFTQRESRRTSDPVPPGRDQGIAVGNYSFTLDALTLKPSNFCNVGLKSPMMRPLSLYIPSHVFGFSGM